MLKINGSNIKQEFNHQFLKQEFNHQFLKISKNLSLSNSPKNSAQINKHFYCTSKKTTPHCEWKRILSGKLPDSEWADSYAHAFYCSEEGHHCYINAAKHPLFLRKYLQVANYNHENKKLTFVWGGSAIWEISRRVIKALGYKNFEWMRFLSEDSSEDKEKKIKKLLNRVEKANQDLKNAPMRSSIKTSLQEFGAIFFFRKQCSIDYDQGNEPYLLSTTLGALHCKFNESPLSFVFGGEVLGTKPVLGNRNCIEDNKIKELSLRMIRSAMHSKGYSEKKIEKIVQELFPLYEMAPRLPIGQLLAFGLPEEMKNFVYNSKMGGIPSGNLLSEKPNEQFRIILSDELIHSDHVTAINIMDSKEVDTLCGSETKYQKELLDKTLMKYLTCKEKFDKLNLKYNLEANNKERQEELQTTREYELFLEKIDAVTKLIS